MESILYFSYGSNMLAERLQERCKSAQAVGIAWVDGYSLAFSKKSIDGSGKGTLVTSSDPAARVYGVLFKLAMSDRDHLDRFEGAAYERQDNFAVMTGEEAEPKPVTTYLAIAAEVDPARRLYDWYLQLVIAGAEQGKLPADYIERLHSIENGPDPDPKRKTRTDALALIKKVG